MDWKIGLVFIFGLTFSQSHFLYYYYEPQPVEPLLLVCDLDPFQPHAHPHSHPKPQPQQPQPRPQPLPLPRPQPHSRPQPQPNPIINDRNDFRPEPQPHIPSTHDNKYDYLPEPQVQPWPHIPAAPSIHDNKGDTRPEPQQILIPPTPSPIGNRLCANGYQFYHNETKKCYYASANPLHSNKIDALKENPCGPLQQFAEVSEGYGGCSCVHDEHGCGTGLPGILNRPVLNWPGTNKCYYAYDQGPCNPGEWLVANHITHRAECKPNPCLGRPRERPIQGTLITPKDDLEVFWFLEESDDTCYQTFTQGYCFTGLFVMFAGTNQKSSCHSTNAYITCPVKSVQPSSHLDCAEGHKKLASGDCVKSVGLE